MKKRTQRNAEEKQENELVKLAKQRSGYLENIKNVLIFVAILNNKFYTMNP